MRRSFTPALSLLAILAFAPAFEATAAEPASSAAVPAVNASFLQQAGVLAGRLLGQANTAHDVAKSAAALPFAGDAAKAKVAKSHEQASAAAQLKGELASLASGNAPAGDGILAQLGSGTGPSLADRFSGLPLASTLQTVLGNRELISALLAAAPLDQVPGYAVAKQALAGFAPAK